MNRGPAELVFVVPITSKFKGVPSHIAVEPPEGGLKTRSFIACEALRSASKERLIKRWGTVSSRVIDEVEDMLRTLLELE
jgi:mRNA interferase MazF